MMDHMMYGYMDYPNDFAEMARQSVRDFIPDLMDVVGYERIVLVDLADLLKFYAIALISYSDSSFDKSNLLNVEKFLKSFYVNYRQMTETLFHIITMVCEQNKHHTVYFVKKQSNDINRHNILVQAFKDAMDEVYRRNYTRGMIDLAIVTPSSDENKNAFRQLAIHFAKKSENIYDLSSSHTVVRTITSHRYKGYDQKPLTRSLTQQIAKTGETYVQFLKQNTIILKPTVQFEIFDLMEIENYDAILKNVLVQPVICCSVPID